ncbi:EamA family transporter RarD [Leifsonia poae]|uniref:Protein RarD n=1 Tax=Leifsonia poae TaxID=110933 RepID=A0A9W6LYM6_9MICO|nr:EamA family transporter RarD [Leifsonia poae]GLJ75000.1 protein RarD [Leifsonia poae]
MSSSETEPAVAVAVAKPLTEHRRSGLIYAISAYVLWGILPIYFLSLVPASAFEIVAWRVLFSLVFCAILLTVTRKWRAFATLLTNKRVVFTMGVAGALIYVNWQTYVLATVSGHVVEAALGYFINPIVTVFLGVIVQREKLRVAQWVAVGISIIAVVVLAVGYGSIPWIALILAFSFGLYGLIKKRVGPSVDAVSGLTLETLWLTPVAIVQLVVVGATVGITIGTISVWHTVAMAGAGVITAVPLLFFAAASRRLPLVYMGFIQYFAPFIQFLVGVVVLHEAMPPERWVGFSIVWLALLILAIDLVASARSNRRTAALDVATVE